MSTRILLIRHGFSRANLTHSLGGQFDSELTDAGLAQAEAMSAFVRAKYDVNAVYASDLKRTTVTARCVAAPLGLTVIPDRRLREICCGEWDGKPVDFIREHYPAEYDRWQNAMGTAHPPKGETVAQVQARALAAVRQIVSRHPGQTVAVVTHQVTIRTLRCFWEGLPIERIDECRLVSNCSVSEIEIDGDRWTPVAVSQDSFLGDRVTDSSTHA